MSTAVGPGTRVQCVRDDWPNYFPQVIVTRKGCIYTVREVLLPIRPYGRDVPYYLFEEIHNPVLTDSFGLTGEPRFASDYFVPVDDGELEWARYLARRPVLEDA